MKNATAEKLAQFAIDTPSSVSDGCADLAQARLSLAAPVQPVWRWQRKASMALRVEAVRKLGEIL
jgi:hypothetical protein